MYFFAHFLPIRPAGRFCALPPIHYLKPPSSTLPPVSEPVLLGHPPLSSLLPPTSRLCASKHRTLPSSILLNLDIGSAVGVSCENVECFFRFGCSFSRCAQYVSSDFQVPGAALRPLVSRARLFLGIQTFSPGSNTALCE